MPARKPLLLAPIALALSLTAAAASTTLPPRKAGLWQTTLTMTMVMDGQAHGGPAAVTVLCTDSQVEAIEQRRMTGNCGSFSGSGGSYTLTGSCPAPNGAGTLTTHGTLTMNSDTSAHMEADSAGPNFSGHIVADSKWIGPCPAGMNPGDRGMMQNGTFVKMGNIMDTPKAP